MFLGAAALACGFDPAQQRMAAGRHTQPLQQTLARTTAQHPAYQRPGFRQPIGLPGITGNHRSQPLDENLTGTVWTAAAPAGDIQLEGDAHPLQRKVSDVTSIPAVPGPPHDSTIGADGVVLTPCFYDPPLFGRHHPPHRQPPEPGE